MLIHLNTQADLEEAIHALVKQDQRLKPIFELAGMPAECSCQIAKMHFAPRQS